MYSWYKGIAADNDDAEDARYSDVEGRKGYEHDLKGAQGSNLKRLASYSNRSTVESEEVWGISRRIIGIRLALGEREKVSGRMPCSIGRAVGQYAQRRVFGL